MGAEVREDLGDYAAELASQVRSDTLGVFKWGGPLVTAWKVAKFWGPACLLAVALYFGLPTTNPLLVAGAIAFPFAILFVLDLCFVAPSRLWRTQAARLSEFRAVEAQVDVVMSRIEAMLREQVLQPATANAVALETLGTVWALRESEQRLRQALTQIETRRAQTVDQLRRHVGGGADFQMAIDRYVQWSGEPVFYDGALLPSARSAIKFRPVSESEIRQSPLFRESGRFDNSAFVQAWLNEELRGKAIWNTLQMVGNTIIQMEFAAKRSLGKDEQVQLVPAIPNMMPQWGLSDNGWALSERLRELLPREDGSIGLQ